MVKRYSNWCLATHGHDMAPNDLGPYIAHSDYRTLQAALREALDMSHLPRTYLDGRRIAELRKLADD